jgi:hypothetical protein
MSRINDKASYVTYTTTHTKVIGIGYHNCINCNMETPDPPESELIRFDKSVHGEYIWPGDHWMPPKWNMFNNYLICPECSALVTEVFKSRKS